MRIISFTQQGLNDLNKDLKKKISKRPEAVKSLTRGREMGDLSENGLYKAAKSELADLDRTIRNLKNLIKYAKIVSPTNNNHVQLGHKVLVESIEGKKEYLIVGEYEADPKQNKISIKSPIGHNLMGRKTGEKMNIRTPRGEVVLKILAIN